MKINTAITISSGDNMISSCIFFYRKNTARGILAILEARVLTKKWRKHYNNIRPQYGPAFLKYKPGQSELPEIDKSVEEPIQVSGSKNYAIL